jgi:3-oxoacyl-[acyl-carrier-protein] synthase II
MTWAITAAQMVTCLGTGREENFVAMCGGKNGSRPIRGFDRERYATRRAYEIDDRPAPGGDLPGRASQWLAACVIDVLREANIDLRSMRVALLVGTGLRELRSLELWWTLAEPFHLLQLHFGSALRGAGRAPMPVYTFSNACAASSYALGVAEDLLTLGEADAVIVAGVDSITESMFGLVDRVNPEPPEQLQPFEKSRRGVVMGEGAAAVLLESVDHARTRGKSPLALLRGVGLNCDAFHETAPHVGGIIDAMVDAHDRAGVTPGQIDLLLVHGTGSALNDVAEAQAIQQLFGAEAGRPLVTALKSMIGHTSGASGLVSVVAGIEAMRQSLVPPTIGLTEPIAEASGLTIVTGEARTAHIDLVQVNAFGFGGVNAVVLLERANDE